MSTLTSSSSSPAASPRASFHIQPRSTYTAPSPSLSASTAPSPKSRWSALASSSPSPRRAFNAPSVASNTLSGTAPKLPRAHQTESRQTEKTSHYVNAATQYSPDGLPPTARKHILPEVGSAQPRPGLITTPSSAGQKRKEPDTPDPMSNSNHSPAASSARIPAPQPEPEPRRDPSTLQSDAGAPPPPTQSNASDEPQEARSTHGHSSAPKRSKPEPGTTQVMPILYQDCNAKDLGHLISNMLMELIRLNDRIPLRDGRLTRFHSRATPGISVSDYLQRLIHHATLSPPILLSMVYYIDRLCQLYPVFTINSLTVHRFLITAATVAAKGLSDAFWTNPTYARIGGIPVSELATLELEFLEKVQWKIVPKPEVLEDYYRSLVDRTEGYVLEGAEESELADSSRSTSLGDSEDGSGVAGAEGEANKNEDGDDDEDVSVCEPT